MKKLFILNILIIGFFFVVQPIAARDPFKPLVSEQDIVAGYSLPRIPDEQDMEVSSDDQIRQGSGLHVSGILKLQKGIYALVDYEGSSFTVRQGEKFASRFLLKEINLRSRYVVILDKTNNVVKKIKMEERNE